MWRLPNAQPRRLALLVLLALMGCNGQEGPRDRVVLAGTIEARESELSFRVSGRIASVEVDEGSGVASGQTVALLDDEDYRLAVERAEAEAAAARAALEALQAGSRVQEVRVAQAALARAEAERTFARAEVRRLETLVARHLASEEQLEQAQLRRDVAEAGVEQARQNLALVREGPRAEEIRRAEAEFQARQSGLAIAKQQLAYTRLITPLAGVVSVRMAEPGEVVASGQPVLRVAALEKTWVRAYLNETDLARVRLGQAAHVEVDGIDRSFEGRLSFISPEAEFTPKTVETRQLRVGLVYRIKVQVDNPERVLKIGMPADVTIPISPP